MQQIHSRGYLLAGALIGMTGAVCFSTKAIFVKLAYLDHPIDAITLLALRMLFSLPFFIIPALVTSNRKGNVRFTGREWFYIALLGCLGYYVSSYLDFLGLQYVTAGIERLILFAYPTFVLIISTLFLGKKATLKEWIAVAITYTGLVIAFSAEASVNDSREFYLGSALILICAFTFALYIAGSGRIIPSVGAVKFNSYAMSFAAAAVLAHFFIRSESSLIGLPWSIYALAVAMALIGTVIPSYLVSIGINRLGANTISVIASIGPVSTIIQAHYFLDEPFTLMQGVGTILIIAGIVFISWKPGQAQTEPDARKSRQAAVEGAR